MGSSAEELVLRITGDSESAKDAIKGLEDRIKEATTSFGKAAIEGLGPMGEAAGVTMLAAVALGTAVMELGAQAEVVGAQIGKMSAQFNIAVGPLSDLRFAITAAGGDIDSFGNSMFMFQNRMENSSSKVDTGLKQIGLSVEGLNALSPDQQFLKISDALRGTGDDVNRAAVAFDIFGRQGKEMLPLLLKPLDDLTLKSRELGATWSEEDVAAARKFKAESSLSAAETSAAWISLGREMAPVSNSISLGWDRMKLAVANVALTAADVIGPIATFGDEIEALMPDAETSRAALERLGGELPKVATSLKGLADGSGLAAKGLKDWADAVNAYIPKQTTLDEALDNEKESIRDLDSETKKHIETMEKHKTVIDALVAGLEGESKKSGDIVEAVKRVIATHTEDAETIQRVVDQIDKLYDHGVKVSDEMLIWSDANRVLKGSLDNIGMKLTQIGVLVPENSRHMRDMSDMFDEAHQNADNLVGSWNEFNGGLTIAGDEMSSTTIPLFSELTKGILPQAAQAAHDFAVAGKQGTDDWSDSLGGLSRMLKELGRTSNSAFGGILNDLGQMVQLTSTMQKNGGMINQIVGTGSDGQPAFGGTFAPGGTFGMPTSKGGQMGFAGMQVGAGMLADATNDPATAGGVALNDAAKGAQMGAMFGPWGMAIGAAAGLVVGIISGKPEWAKAADEVGKDFGVKISESLAKSIVADAKKEFGGSEQASAISHLSDILKEAGGLSEKNLPQMTARLHDVFSMIETHQMTIEQGTKVLDDNFAEFAKAGTDADGRLSDSLKQIVQLQGQFGTQSKAIADYLQGQGSTALTGFSAVVGGMLTPDKLKVWDDLHQKLTDANNVVRDQTKGWTDWGAASASAIQDTVDAANNVNGAAQAAKSGLKDLGIQAVASFTAAVASGTSEADALKAIHPALATIQKAYSDLGLNIDDAALSAIMMRDQIVTAAPELTGAIGGLNSEMIALDNMGLMNVDTFGAMQRTGKAMYDQLSAKVHDLGGTDRDVLSQMQSFLHQAEIEAKNLGVPLDDNTQSLIDQSKQAGIWQTAITPSDKLLAGMQSLVDKVGTLLDHLNGIPPKVDTTVTTHFVNDGAPPAFGGEEPTFASRGGYVTARGVQYLAGGGNVLRMMPRGTDTVPAMLSPGELVLTARDQALLGHLVASSSGAISGRLLAGAGQSNLSGAVGGGGGVNVYVTVEGNVMAEKDLSDAIQGHIMDSLRPNTQLGLRTARR